MTRSRSGESKPERKATEYIYTRSGGKIYPGEMVEEDIRLDDIAYGLSQIKRFNGQTPISVLRHSIAVANHFDSEKESDYYRCALLHDAAEAYMMDVPVPLKRYMTRQWAADYDRVEALIVSKFDVSPLGEVWQRVREVDQLVVEYEMDYEIRKDDARMSYPCPKTLKRSEILELDSKYMWDFSDRELIEYFRVCFSQK